MCELLGMSANVPTDIRFSFTGLMQRGGHTGPHRDGWGIAFYGERGARLFHDPCPSCESEVARLVQQHSIKSRIVISHIRRANRGRVCLENTHPFTRELWGRSWVFAHNGELKGIKRRPCGPYEPIGSTDSEHAFCWLLGRIRERFPQPPRVPATLWRYVAGLAAELNQLGIFNFLLSDSRWLYAHCSTKLAWLTRRAPFGEARLTDADMAVDFQGETTPDDVVTVIATQPLTGNERWNLLAPGDFIVFDGGEPVWQHGVPAGCATPSAFLHPG
ncbi:MAG TPA: class II glutamine amidotransferase [Plasticicumulans sp.]|uniref:class II glutamine amidotransferase n=1 Tax=Plasticicumulans sp. TaxID=2307179 RepID=UPI002C4F9A79|nr:class II glutamine amidotransferase [Plasticicumulans sp.]MBS0600226.1 class II glutamine amidotransferase [Pseudomonadota bacterium]HMV38887.1 class II glutamine amidotransferase [Plasticicumulans sp.]HMW42464.1 class II glutamine amidotransferase [Plasticicumulans sp.]HMZ09517.1 class II glutamine amidotransferase [Plasticicumulans sp.]HNF66025.1 class II glutamine amidotransferase [Plasticicumulans sp.]